MICYFCPECECKKNVYSDVSEAQINFKKFGPSKDKSWVNLADVTSTETISTEKTLKGKNNKRKMKLKRKLKAKLRLARLAIKLDLSK